MSLFKSILSVAAPIIGGVFGGPVGAALGGAIGGAIAPRPPAPAPVNLVSGSGGWGGGGDVYTTQTMGALPPIISRGLPALGGAVMAGGRAVMRSAQTYCRRHPAWCAQIGGTAAIMAMIESGQLPPIRHRRGRGITPKDLRSFRRVANLVRGFCPTVRRIPSRALHVRRTGIQHA